MLIELLVEAPGERGRAMRRADGAPSQVRRPAEPAVSPPFGRKPRSVRKGAFRPFAGKVISTSFAGFLLALIFPLCRTAAAEPRGTWWWTSAGQPWGVDQVLGDNNKETQVLQFLKAWNFGRVYCSFSTQTRANPAVIRAWNTKLHAAGISSQLLLSENTWIFPQNRTNLLTVHIQPKLIDFNAASPNAAERYDGLHLDIEPQGLPQWGTNTPAGRRDLLLLLRDTFQAVRTYLDQHGAADIPVYADLPVWYDQLPTPVGWDSTAERDAWFAALGQSLAGISLMAYDRDTADSIESGVSWEIQNFTNECRVALEADVGTNGNTWLNFYALMAMIQTEEHTGTPPRRMDVHDFVHFHDLPQPIETWRSGCFGTNANRISVSGDNADPDQDGIPNLLEYAFALDPLVASTKGLPAGSLTTTGGTNFLTVTFQRPMSATDVTYRVLVASNLYAWETGCTFVGTNITSTTNAALISRSMTNALETDVVRDAAPIPAAAARFMKIQVTHP